MIDTKLALSIFVGTVPILGAIVWNLVKLDRIEKRVDAIVAELTLIRERLATLEERDRWTHPVVHP
jgi:hypothetical protein